MLFTLVIMRIMILVHNSYTLRVLYPRLTKRIKGEGTLPLLLLLLHYTAPTGLVVTATVLDTATAAATAVTLHSS